jgi:hypothetical protein
MQPDRPTQMKHENPEIAAAILRMTASLGRRIGDADPYDLELLRDLSTAVDAAWSEAVKRLRKQGYSWTEIGDGAGITRQAAQQRWT